MHSTPTILSKIIPPAFLIILEEEDVLSVLKQVAQYTGFHLLCSASGVSIWKSLEKEELGTPVPSLRL